MFNLLVNLSLVLLPLLRRSILNLLLLEDISFLLCLVLSLHAGKVGVVDALRNLINKNILK